MLVGKAVKFYFSPVPPPLPPPPSPFTMLDLNGLFSPGIMLDTFSIETGGGVGGPENREGE